MKDLPIERLDARFMVTIAYIDESGTHGAESPTVVLSGFLSSADRWAAYDHDVSALFREMRVSHFHAIDLRKTKRDFVGWTARKKAILNTNLLKLADGHLEYGVSVILPKSEYDKFYTAGGFPKKVQADTHYGLCVRMFLFAALALLDERPSEWPINFVLEDGNKNAGDALRVFANFKAGLKAEHRAMFGEMSFESKKACKPLAASDHLAYHTFRMEAGYQVPSRENLISTGPSEPVFLVRNCKVARLALDQGAFEKFRAELLAEHAWRQSYGRRQAR